jgi:hypothetical protein
MACMRTCRIILTRIRGRWGEERFRNIFKRTVEPGLTAKDRHDRGCAHRRLADALPT